MNKVVRILAVLFCCLPLLFVQADRTNDAIREQNSSKVRGQGETKSKREKERIVSAYHAVYPCKQHLPIRITGKDFTLAADSGSLLHDLTMDLSTLSYDETASMPSNMENVTGSGNGIRLLPNGEHFAAASPARLTLAYDPMRLPKGYKAEDIYTYYSDDAGGWHRLERIATDTTAHTITSVTTHFTDFANAVIRIPEMPESKAFVPTAMTDIPDADPMHGIPMVETPRINNRGTAELTYPIALPKGRGGMQPNVDLHYSSTGGNGILGVGWSLNTPHITIDTRRGVPRFDPLYESEEYTVNGAAVVLRQETGEAFALPHHDKTYTPRTGGKVRFYTRNTENQERILRFGNNPTNYWWAITDKNGVTTYYGRRCNPFGDRLTDIDEESINRNENGCITYWAATASVDIHGNYILYHNERAYGAVHTKMIYYTGNIRQNITPTYRVCFGYTERNDIVSNGCLGGLQEEKLLLCHILIQYLGENYDAKTDVYTDNLAAYYMQYTPPQETTLYKSRLEEVVMLDSVPDLILDDVCSLQQIYDGDVKRNRLSEKLLEEAKANGKTDVYEKILATLKRPYGEGSIPAHVTKFAYKDAPLAENLFEAAQTLPNSAGTELSESHSRGWSIGGTATVGVGSDIVTTSLSGGGQYEYGKSEGRCRTMLIDLNGDGLKDIVFEEGGTVYYKRQYEDGGTYLFAEAEKVKGLSRLSREVSKTHTWGVQMSLGANLSYSHPATTTYTDTYFSDVNADGLPDMIDGDKILINQLADEIPTFGTFTGIDTQNIAVGNSRCGTIMLDGEADDHIECDVKEILVHSYSLFEFFGSDTNYSIEEDERIQDTQEAYPKKLYFDTEKAEKKGKEYEQAGKKAVQTTTEGTPAIQSSYSPQAAVAIRTEDSLIYRIENDRVNAYRLEYICRPVKTEPDIETVRVWVAPRDGNITLCDSIALTMDTSLSRLRSRTADGIAYTLQHCSKVTEQNDGMRLHAEDYTLLHQGKIAEDDSLPKTWTGTLNVRKGDIIMFRLRSGENNLFDKTQWRHIIHYAGDSNTYDSEQDFLCTGKGEFQALYAGQVVITLSRTNEGEVPITVKVRKQHNDKETEVFAATLHHGNTHAEPQTIPVAAYDKITICAAPTEGNTETLQWGDIHIVPKLQYIADFPLGDSSKETTHDTILYYPDIYADCKTDYPASSAYSQLFGALYKGWGVFAYQNLQNSDTIFLDSLINTQQLAAERARQNSSFQTNHHAQSFSKDKDWQTQTDNAFAEGQVFNPTAESNYWIPMRADSRLNRWIAYGNSGCIGKRIHSNARETTLPEEQEDITEFDSSLPFTQGETRKNNFVRKQSRSVQHSVSWGAPILVNASASRGTYESVVDYMDMNGDGYPDFTGKGGIQYSTPWGGIGRLQAVEHYKPFSSSNTAEGVSFSACPAALKKAAGNNMRDGRFFMNATAGGSGGAGHSSTQTSYADMNGDGLPDIADLQNQTIRYNVGYRFSEPYPFTGYINEGLNVSRSLSGTTPPFSIAQVSISGGCGKSVSENETETVLADINGDGLPDKVRVLNNQVSVAYNKGTGPSDMTFDSWKVLPRLTAIEKNSTENFSTTLGATGGFTLFAAKVNIGIQSSPHNESTTRTETMLTDMNGDGLPDYVWKENNQIRVCYNTAGNANLLTAVTNPTGQEIRLDYTLSEPSTAHRNRQWDLREIRDVAPNHPMEGAKQSIIRINYSNPYYDNFEKTDYGYEYVQTVTNGKKIKEERYHNQSFLQNGKLREDLTKDSDGKKYIRHIYDNKYRNIVSKAETDSGDDICDDANVYVSEGGYRTEYFEGQTEPQIVTRYDIQYDQHHNIVRYTDYGDTAIPDDDWQQDISYLRNTGYNMVSLPKDECITDKDGELLRYSYANYSLLGQPAHIHRVDKEREIFATTHIEYDPLGNIAAIIQPENSNGEHSWITFQYDTITYSNVVATDNPFHAGTVTRYDYRWGLPTSVTDPAGNEIRYTYDYKGRINTVLAPEEARQGKDYTVRFTYNLINHNLKRESSYPFTHVYKDMYDSAFVQQEVALYDTRGRMMQKKHYAKVAGKDQWITDKAEEWDAFGRTVARAYPFVTNRKAENYCFIGDGNGLPERTEYDALDRPILQVHADGTKKVFKYSIETDKRNLKRFLAIQIDENDIYTGTLTSPQGWLTEQIAGDGSSTSFAYSPIGELLQTTDADGYKTIYQYDRLGRLTKRVHPDAGTTTWAYDPAGNVIEKKTANLAGQGTAIQYDYTFNRLSDIRYPLRPENDVHYQYDKAGRITLRQDGTGTEEFVYAPLGNVAQSVRKVVIPTETAVYVFRTTFKHDSFGRMRDIVYPDGEAVHYGYKTGGLLQSVTGVKNGQQNIYLKNRQYDEQSRKTLQLYGNGVQTNYEYDERRQWMTHTHTELPDGTTLQDLSYTYDAAGNITNIQHDDLAISAAQSGKYFNEYTYDAQYRLVESYGDRYKFRATYSPAGRQGSRLIDAAGVYAEMEFGYDAEKASHQPRNIYDTQNETADLFWDANGNLAQVILRKQNAARFHEWDEENRLRFVLGEKFAGYYGYDANGERVYKLTGTSSIDQVNSGHTRAQVVFDDAVLYPNPYIVVTPKGYTKHYYAGTERLATSIGGGGLGVQDTAWSCIDKPTQDEVKKVEIFYRAYESQDPFMQQGILSDTVPTADIRGDKQEELFYRGGAVLMDNLSLLNKRDMLYYAILDNAKTNKQEKEVFYCHSDHLGSANWITESVGKPIQYIQYAPFGELLVNETSGGYDERYKFTGKERDAETGYDYFGARYYSYALGGYWLSVDPMSDKYPNISPYAYCNWNPVKYVDPDGRKIKIAGNFIARVLGRLGVQNYQGKVMSALSQLKDIDPEINQMISQLETSDVEYTIKPTTERPDGKNGNAYYSKEKTIYFNPDNNKRANGEERDAIVGLAHELGHAENDDNGTRIPYNRDAAQKGDPVEKEKWNQNERNSIRKENIVRDKLNLPQRDETYIL